MKGENNIRNLLKRRGKWLLLLGAALTALGMFKLLTTPPLAQYIAEAPAETSEASALASTIDAWEKNALNVTADQLALFATVSGRALSSNAETSATGALTGVEAGYTGIYPKYLLTGRWFSNAELKAGERLMVLDEQLAFSLFPTTDALEGSVQIGEHWYRVIGVVRHKKGAGDLDDFGAYVALRALANAKFQMEYITACAYTDGRAGVTRALNEAATVTLGAKGNLYDLSKEIMRWTMMLRVLFLLFALYALFALLRLLNAAFLARFRIARDELKRRYLRDLLPGIIARVLVFIAAYAGLALTGYSLLSLTIQPMYVFTEWVPQIAVEWSSYVERATALLTENARTAALRTPEMAEIRVYGSLLRWGAITLLCGYILFMKKPRERG